MSNRKKIIIEGYGKQKVTFYEIENTNELFDLTFQMKNKNYSAICDNCFRILTPITEDRLIEIYTGHQMNDYAFTYQINDKGDYYSWHLSREEDGLFYPIAKYHGGYDTKCRFVGTEKDNYWLLESNTFDTLEYSLYDIAKRKIITPPVSVISFEQKKGNILAYIEIQLMDKIDKEEIVLDNLVGFIDYEGNFASDLYSIETDQRFDVRKYNLDKSFASFKNFKDKLIALQVLKYKSEKQHIDEVIDDLYYDSYCEQEVYPLKQHTKIIPFKREVT